MILTAAFKLNVSSEQRSKLLRTTYNFNAACDFISAFAFKNRIFSKFKLQAAVYREIRTKFGLAAQAALHAIRIVAATYKGKGNKSSLHTFKKHSAVGYDDRILSFRNNHSAISISVFGQAAREVIPLQSVPHLDLGQLQLCNNYKLCYRKQDKSFYLHLSYEVPENQLQHTPEFLGVDLGIKNIAATSHGVTYISQKTEAVRNNYNRLRAELQQKGTKSAKKRLVSISKRERSFKKSINHLISKLIVSAALRHSQGIALEDLVHIRERTVVRKQQRDKQSKWAFSELRNFISYKAKLAGIPVIIIDPRNTSRTCYQCKYCDKRNRTGDEFHCINCGYQQHADLNAADNIAFRARSLRLMLEELFQGLNFGIDPLLPTSPVL